MEEWLQDKHLITPCKALIGLWLPLTAVRFGTRALQCLHGIPKPLTITYVLSCSLVKRTILKCQPKHSGSSPHTTNGHVGTIPLAIHASWHALKWGTDLGAVVLRPMAEEYIRHVQACLREATMANYDAIDDMWFEVTSVVASVRVNAQLWLAELYGFPATFHWVQVTVVGTSVSY